MVLVDRTIIVDQHDVYVRFHVAVLKTVIQDDYFRFFRELHEFLDATHSIRIHGYRDFREFVLYLHGFVPDVVCRGVFRCQHETRCLSFIPPAETGYTVIIFQLVDQGFRVRGFSRSAHGDISHANNGNVKLPYL